MQRTGAGTVREKLLIVLKVAVSLGLVAYVVTRPTILEADWATILAGIRFWPWLLGLTGYSLAIGLNVLKWQFLLRRLEVRVPFWSLFRHNMVGLFFALLPLSMVGGDIARGWDLARHTDGQAAPVAVSVLVDRLVGLAAFLTSSVALLTYAILVLGRSDFTWLLTTMIVVTVAFAVAFAVLMSQRLRRLVERMLALGPLARLLPIYDKLSGSVQVYRTQAGALAVAWVIALGTVAATCVVNYLAAVTVGADVPFIWACVLTPLTPFALYIPSIASGLGVNQAVFVALYHNLAGILGQAPAFALSLAMQTIIYVSSLPGAVLWWQRRGVASRRS